MKYVNKSVWVAFVLGLVGCTTTGDKVQLVTDADVQPELLSTLEYLPEQEADEEGRWLEYEPSTNPYASQRGRVKKDSVVTFIEARRAFNAKQFDQAQALLGKLIEQDPSLSGPWVMLGDIAAGQEDYPQAVQHYLKAVNINRSNVNAYLRLARVQRLQGQFLHAQNTYAQLLAVWPDFPEAHLNLAVLYDIYLNHPIRAQKHMEAYQFLTDADNGEVSAWLAEIRQRTGIAPSFHVDAGGSTSGSLSYSADNQEAAAN